MKNTLLITAVLLEIRAFVNRNTPFSAYDITCSLRKKANAREIHITDLDCLASGVARLVHPQIKAIIDELYNEDLLPVARTDNGEYRIYSSIKISPSAPAAVTTTSTARASTVVANDVEDLVVGYVTRKLTKGELPTLKSVQSCLKNSPITVDEIQKICLGKGFKVSPQAGLKPSLSVIYK